MIRYIADTHGKITGKEDAVPVCGKDFCEDCGDCLVCYVEDSCFFGWSDQHMWVRYQERVL